MRRLRLNREALADLSPEQLAAVDGGTTTLLPPTRPLVSCLFDCFLETRDLNCATRPCE